MDLPEKCWVAARQRDMRELGRAKDIERFTLIAQRAVINDSITKAERDRVAYLS